MAMTTYEYAIEDCDVPEVRHGKLTEYRKLRSKCLDLLGDSADTSVGNQIRNLAWQTTVFRTLNEGRRLESTRPVNGALWELITAGYANLVTLGIRKLVDTHDRSGSVPIILKMLEQQSELLTREMFVCYDGLPYDYGKVKRSEDARVLRQNNGVWWGKTRGPLAWSTSERMHEFFDRFTGNKDRRMRDDRIPRAIFDTLKAQLSHPAIEKVCTFVDKHVAHAERIDQSAAPIPVATYNDVDAALRQIVRVTSFISSAIFADALGSVVPTPQFDVLEHLDQPWVTTSNIAALQQHWDELSSRMDSWEHGVEQELFSESAKSQKNS
jgi:hypothetical protein